MRRHESQLAIFDDDRSHAFRMIGCAPRHKPYLTVTQIGLSETCTITNRASLRALARRILVAIGDKAPTK